MVKEAVEEAKAKAAQEAAEAEEIEIEDGDADVSEEDSAETTEDTEDEAETEEEDAGKGLFGKRKKKDKKEEMVLKKEEAADMEYGFGVDIGGTTVKLAFFDQAGTLLHKWEIKTNTENGGCSILPDIAASVNTFLKEKNRKKCRIFGFPLDRKISGG